MKAVPEVDWIYGFGFSELRSCDRVHQRLRLLQNPKLRRPWDDDYCNRWELSEILREPECTLALSEGEIFRLIEENLEETTQLIDRIGRRPVNYQEIMAAIRSDLESLAHQALRAA